MDPKNVPHYLRVARALTLVTGLALPVAVQACGGETSTGGSGNEDASPGPVTGPVTGVQPYQGPEGGGGIAPYDASTDGSADAKDETTIITGVLPFDAGGG